MFPQTEAYFRYVPTNSRAAWLYFPLSQIATSNPRLQPDTDFAVGMFPYNKTELFQRLGFTYQLPKKPGNTPLSGTWFYLRDINTTVSTCPETVEKIIILVHAVWELFKVGTCCSGICQKYDAPLPLMISATLQNTLNWNLAIYSQSFFIIQYASI